MSCRTQWLKCWAQPACGSGMARAPQWPTPPRKHSSRWLGLTWGSERNLLEGGDRGAFWTWFNLHPQLVERVFLSGDVHVLPKQSSSCCGLQAGVSSSWPKTNHRPHVHQAHVLLTEALCCLSPRGLRLKGITSQGVTEQGDSASSSWAF